MSKISNYYDYAAATPLLKEAKEAMEPFFDVNFYNPSALYLDAKNVKNALNESRQTVARELGAKPTEIIFTAGGTEANNLAIQGILNHYENSNIVISSIEHDSVIEPATLFENSIVDVDDQGLVKMANLAEKIDDNTVLVSVMYVNNEIGTIQPLVKIAQLIDEVKKDRQIRGIAKPIYFHTDACQAVNYLDIQVSKLGVDLMTLNSGKVYGPKQCGALFVKSGVKIKPLILGGGQERGLRSGTENVANIVGFAEALKNIRNDYKIESSRLSKLRDAFINNLKLHTPDLKVNGSINKNRICNNIHLLIPGIDNEWLTMSLDEQGFQVATGSACSASSDKPSHVLSAIGFSDKQAQNCIRITLGRYTNEADLNNLQQSLIKTLAK